MHGHKPKRTFRALLGACFRRLGTFTTRTQLAFAPRRHRTRDTDVRGGATLHTHWTSRPLTATARQVPAPSSQTCSTSPALGFRPALSWPPVQTCGASGPWKGVRALWHRGLGVHTCSPAGQRRTRRLWPSRAPCSTGRLPGTPPHPLVTHTHTHTPATLGQTGRQPHVPEGIGRSCLGKCVLRCHRDQNGRCSPGHSDAARSLPITAFYTPPLHTRTHTRLGSVFPPPPSPRGGSPRKSKQCGTERAEEDETEIRVDRVPSSRSHTSVCCVWQTPGVHNPGCSEMCPGRGREEEVKHF